MATKRGGSRKKATKKRTRKAQYVVAIGGREAAEASSLRGAIFAAMRAVTGREKSVTIEKVR